MRPNFFVSFKLATYSVLRCLLTAPFVRPAAHCESTDMPGVEFLAGALETFQVTLN